ncbi:DNA-binding domain-containing protein [Methyloceanibacter caenitepidi]|uniref:Conserved domain protein n=1 Tax=Methyloceanibacter caenitepidi TaxID=1384459 RepID=A0A0A8K6K2_9HYPH|nr:DNA-binding domain-containing protein [Methyloceanibacter caenitepidi]BAQ18550.1 conserved domain protein [Methyloceanibacter caenitepidi]
MTSGAGQRESVFAQALLDSDVGIPDTLKGRDGRRPTRRFAVYRNNVYASLIDMLAGRFPATAKLVGEEFFRAMAREYVEKTPPRSAVLLRYGGDVPDFIDAFPPASAVPYLADVARLEWAWHEAYHAADAEPLSQDALTALGPRAEDIGFVFHPSSRLVRSAYPVITIWELTMRDGEDEPGRLPAGGEDALVLRPVLQVTVRRLPPGGAAFAEALMAGEKLPAAARIALELDPAFDLAANLGGLMRSSALAAAR